MPRERRSPGEFERAQPFRPDQFAEAEPQEARGAPGSRDMGGSPEEVEASRPNLERSKEGGGVNPLPAIDPSMPHLKTGDQGG